MDGPAATSPRIPTTVAQAAARAGQAKGGGEDISNKGFDAQEQLSDQARICEG